MKEKRCWNFLLAASCMTVAVYLIFRASILIHGIYAISVISRNAVMGLH